MFLAFTQELTAGRHLVPHLKNTILIKEDEEYFLMSRICPHQNARLTACNQHLECPYHGYKFDYKGVGVNNDYRLDRLPVYRVGNLLFSAPPSFNSVPYNWAYMSLKEHRIDTVEATEEIIIDTFLDIDHIPVAHKGVYNEIGITDITNVTVECTKTGSVQFVPGTTQYQIDDDAKHGLAAFWLCEYPRTMFEWQPGAIFVTIAEPSTNKKTQVHVLKYRDTRYNNTIWELNNKIWEQAWAQDRVLSESIVKLPNKNLNNLKQHHRDWLNASKG